VKVAKLAGVSSATVSRVINNRPDVSSANVQRVRDAMDRLRYVPPANRRGPKPKAQAKRTGSIALLFVGEQPTLARSPVVGFVLHAIQEELARNGYNLTLGTVTNAGELPLNVTSGRVDGLFMHGSPPPDDVEERLSRYSACVWLLSQRRQRGYWGDRVSPDNDQVGVIAARHLIDRGHQHIAALHNDTDHLGFDARIKGFESEARAAGVPFRTIASDGAILTDTDQISRADAQLDAVIDQLLADEAGLPTGLFIPRDPVTIRMYRALRARGIEPGRDIEIVSCDNIPALDALDPRPSTIDVRPGEIGRRAVEQLLWRLNDNGAPMNVTAHIEPRLVPGDANDPITRPEPGRPELSQPVA